jgi:hypothetical protein
MSLSASTKRRFADLSIAAKLYGMAGMLLVLMLAVGLLGMSHLSSSASLGRDMYGNSVLAIEHLDESRAALGRLNADILALPAGTATPAQFLTAYAGDSSTLRGALAKYTVSGVSPDERPSYERLMAVERSGRGLPQALAGLAASGRTAALRRLIATKVAVARATADAALAKLITINER